MSAPNYFLADLPPEATVSSGMILDACQTLKRNRERYLVDRSVESIIYAISRVAEQWVDPEFPYRKQALQFGPATIGFSEQTLATGLDNFFKQITARNLETLILQELGHAHRIDRFAAAYLEEQADRASLARGPELLVHITGGVLPNPPIMSIILGLLVRSAQFVKCASGTGFIPRLFLHSLYDAESKLGACIEIAEWKGGTSALEKPLFAEATCVTATGSDDTLKTIQEALPRNVRFIGYGHRVSFGYIGHEVLSGMKLQKTVRQAADDVVAWNQLGCLSPHVLYVETGGVATPEKFAELLATELQHRESSQPRGKVSDEEAAAIAYRRSFYEVRAAGTNATRLWQSEKSTAWTVVYENDPQFQLSCLNRFIYVKAVPDLDHVLRGSDSVYGKVSTVGIALEGARAETIAHQLARWGVSRICPLGQMQNPPLTWRHDGRPALADLVTWCDWEM
jgi:hypothetical protein